MCFRRFISILILLSGTITTACLAQTWDATKDFRPSNPNGNWSYGMGVAGTSFAPYTIYNPDCAHEGVAGFVCWTAEITWEHVPFVALNTTGEWLNWWTVVAPPDILVIHPGPDPGQDTIVRFTAPVTAHYKIAGFFEILDTNPSGVMGLIYRNRTLLYSGQLLGPPAQHPDKVGGREDFYFVKLFLNAGDVLSFSVNKDGTYYYDSTGFNVEITIPPIACAACPQ